MDTKTGSILLLHTRNTPQPQRQTLTQRKGLGPKKQACVDILISNKIDFKVKLITIDREGQFIFITRKTHQDEVSILNIYAPNTRAHNLLKKDY